MKDFLVKALLEPFLAIAFCLAFGVPFVYTGFQTIHVTGRKTVNEQVSMDISRQHFWGLYTVDAQVEDVRGAEITTSRPKRIGKGRRLLSGVYLVTKTNDYIRLMAGSSNVDGDIKREMVYEIRDFIEDPEQIQFNQTFRIQNVFGWVGLPFLSLGVLGLIGWPGAIIRNIKD